MPFDGIIFDVDGTVWDSTPVVEQAWNRALEEAGYAARVTALRLKSLFGLTWIRSLPISFRKRIVEFPFPKIKYPVRLFIFYMISSLLGFINKRCLTTR